MQRVATVQQQQKEEQKSPDIIFFKKLPFDNFFIAHFLRICNFSPTPNKTNFELLRSTDDNDFQTIPTGVDCHITERGASTTTQDRITLSFENSNFERIAILLSSISLSQAVAIRPNSIKSPSSFLTYSSSPTASRQLPQFVSTSSFAFFPHVSHHEP